MAKNNVTNHYINNNDFLNALIQYKKDVEQAKQDDLPKPKIPEYIGMCFMKIAENLAKRPNFFAYCVDDKTEAFTKRGWLSYDKIEDDDEILCVDTETLENVWSRIKGMYVNREYSGTCIKIDGQIDALVTSGHNWLTKRGIVSVDDLELSDYVHMLGSCIVQDIDAEYSDNHIKFLGWLVSNFLKREKVDGGEIYTFPFVKAKGNDRKGLFDLILYYSPKTTFLSKAFSKYGDFRFFVSDELLEEFSSLYTETYGYRTITFDFINKLSTRQLLLLKESLLTPDGYIGKYNNKCMLSVDAYTYIATLLGNISEYGVDSSGFYGKINLDKKGLPICTTQDLDFDEQFYYGTVWCPTTEYGTFVCRRNGTIYVTGNSFKEEMQSDAIENCCNYFENFDPNKSSNPFSYFTQIAWYAFLRRIAKEKDQMYIKYKVTENFGVLDEAEILELSNGESQQLELYDNMYDFIKQYEDNKIKKKESKKKGLEVFFNDDDPEIFEGDSSDDE